MCLFLCKKAGERVSFKGYKRSIVLDFSYDQVKKGVPDVNRQMALLNAEFRKASEEVKKTGSSFEKLALQQELLTNRTKLQADKVEILKKELETLTKSEGNNEKAIARKTIELTKAEAQLAKTQNELQKVNKEVEDQTSKLGTMATKWKDTTEKLKDAGVDIDRVAGGMQKTGAAMMSIGVIGAKASMDFGKEFNKVKTIADETQVSFKSLEKGTLKLSRDINIGAGELANALYEVNSANIETADSLNVLSDAAKLAKAGNADVASTVSVLTGAINAYGLEVDKSRELSDKLLITQKLGNLVLNDLGDGFGRVASLAATANVPIEEVYAALASLTTGGMTTSEAITTLRSMLSAIIKPSKEVADKSKELGLNFSLAGIQSKGFAGFLEEVTKKSRGNKEVLTELFGTANAMTGALRLSGEGAELFAKALDEMNNSAGTTDEALKKIQDSTGERWSKSINEMKVSLIELGGALSPVIDLIAGFINLLAKMPTGVLVAITSIGGLLLIIGTVIKTIGSVATTINSVKGVIDIFNNTAGNATYLTFLKWAGIIIAVTLAITALVVAINYLIGKGGEMNKAVSDITGVMGKAQGAVAQSSQKAYAIGTNYAEGGWATVNEHGRERMYVPRGTKIIDSATTKHMEEMEQRNYIESNKEIANKLDRLVDVVMGIKQEVYNMPERQKQIGRMGVAKG